MPVGGNFVLHVDGNYSKTDDLEIGGHALTPALRAQALASPDPAIRALADISGRLPNSAAETWDVAAGAAWIEGDNNAGFSINHYDSLYGVPIRYSLDPAIEAEAPRIDIAQTRVDGRAEIDTGSGFLDSIRLRGGYSDYRHFELEEDGAVGTRFDSNGYEGRAEFRQSTRGGWGGGFGAQYFHRDFAIEGAEKFLPPSSTSQLGLFVLETLDRGAFKAEGGLRYEHTLADRRCRSGPRQSGPAPQLRRDHRAPPAPPTPSPRAGGSASTPRAASARPRPRNCSPTARMPEPRASRSAIPISASSGAGGSRPRCAAPAPAIRSAPPSSTAGSTATFSRRRPARSRTICRSSSISRPMPAISGSSWKARLQRRRGRLGS